MKRPTPLLPTISRPRATRLDAEAQSRLAQARAKIVKQIQPQLEALARASRVTAGDLEIRIVPSPSAS